MQGQGLMQGCRRTFHLHGGRDGGQNLIYLFVYCLCLAPSKGKIKKKLFLNQQRSEKENPSFCSAPLSLVDPSAPPACSGDISGTGNGGTTLSSGVPGVTHPKNHQKSGSGWGLSCSGARADPSPAREEMEGRRWRRWMDPHPSVQEGLGSSRDLEQQGISPEQQPGQLRGVG